MGDGGCAREQHVFDEPQVGDAVVCASGGQHHAVNLRCLTFCAQVQPTRGIVNGSQGLLHSLTFDGAIMYILKYMAKPTAGACMALANCDDGDDDMPTLEA